MKLFLHQLLATVRKEWTLMSRDIGGLAVLMIMPAVLMFLMALVQDAPFREYQDLKLQILVADEDGGALYPALRETFTTDGALLLTDKLDGQSLKSETLKSALKEGRAPIGIVIPKGANAELANAANTIANSIASQMAGGKLPQREPRASGRIRLLFDPVSPPSFRVAVQAALDKAVTGTTTALLMRRLSRLSGRTEDSIAVSKNVQKVLQSLSIQEERAADGERPENINSVQHNVPAWAVFGMFFIVVPLSAHVIREREGGSALRLALIPGAGLSVALGRIFANTTICCLQFALMCAVGYYILPIAGLPALNFGSHPTALLPVVVATGFCATAFGYFVGTLFRSSAQALPFGAISIVILSALGGIWVPVELLQPTLKALAKLSPLHWSLQGIQSVMLRNQSWREVLLPTVVLFCLGLALTMIAQWREAGLKRAA